MTRSDVIDSKKLIPGIKMIFMRQWALRQKERYQEIDIFKIVISVWTERDWMHRRMFPIPSCNPFYLARNPQLLFFAKNNTKYSTDAPAGFLNQYFFRIAKYLLNLHSCYWWSFFLIININWLRWMQEFLRVFNFLGSFNKTTIYGRSTSKI